MTEIHHHPDNLIYVRVGSAFYVDTPENFAADYGSAFPTLPAGARERIYDPDDRHVIYMRGGDVAQGRPWPAGDEIIAAIDKLLVAQSKRIVAANIGLATAKTGAVATVAGTTDL